MPLSQRRKRNILVVQIAFVTFLCLGLILIAITSGVFRPRGGPRQIALRIESTGGVALLTYSYAATSVKEAISVTTPWDKNIVLNSGDQVYLSAGNPSSYGKISCSITVDSRAWKSQTADYPEDKVSCAGIVP